MTFDKKNLVIIGLVVSLGLNIILSFFLFSEKILLKSAPIPKSTVSQQEEKKPELAPPTQQTMSEVRIEKEYKVLIPETRVNDPSNDGWMTRKWNGVYSNPERPWLTDFSDTQFDHLHNRGKGIPDNCPFVNYNDVANSYILFENEELSLRLPFNEKWGSGIFKLEPFTVTEVEENKQQVNFGSAVRVGGEGYEYIGCQWYQPRSFATFPKKSLDEYVARIHSDYNGQNIKLIEMSFFGEPGRKFKVIEFDVAGGYGDSQVVAFLGDSYVYEFDTFWGGTLESLEDIISTIELK